MDALRMWRDPDSHLPAVYRMVYGGPIRKAVWTWAHDRLPCWFMHRACPLCGSGDDCERCFDRAFSNGEPVEITNRMPVSVMRVSPNLASGTSTVRVFPSSSIPSQD